jgi:hypothetical protein
MPSELSTGTNSRGAGHTLWTACFVCAGLVLVAGLLWMTIFGSKGIVGLVAYTTSGAAILVALISSAKLRDRERTDAVADATLLREASGPTDGGVDAD